MKCAFVAVVLSCINLSKAQTDPDCTIPWLHHNYRYVEYTGGRCGIANPSRAQDEVPESEDPIITGRMISDIAPEIGEFPWLARVIATFSRSRVQNTCLGSIIGMKYVLTAASCLFSNGVKADIITAVVGDTILGARDCKEGKCAPEPQSLRVKTSAMHTGFSKNHRANCDIALLKFHYNMTFNGFVLPVCLPYQCTDPDMENDVVYPVVGYGSVEKLILSNPDEYPLETRVVLSRVRGLTSDVCTQKWSEYRKDTFIDSKLHFCVEPVSVRGKACAEDLGGPLVYLQGNSSVTGEQYPMYWLLGHLTFGPACPDAEDTGKRAPPLVYLNVARYTKWIMTNLDTPWLAEVTNY